LSILVTSDNNFDGCYPACLKSSLCRRLHYFNTNIGISDDNNFDATWEDFCDLGVEACTNCVPPAAGIIECTE